MLRTILRSSIGKVGLLFLFILVAGSIIVTVTYPRNFGNQIWNNPAYWADYPKLAAPKWTAWFDSNKIQHQVLISTSPDSVLVADNEDEKVVEYYFTTKFSSKSDPTFLSFSVSQLKFHEVSPIITVFLEQGEQRLFVYRHVVPQKAANEPSPVIRYVDSPFRVQLTSDFAVQRDVANFFDILRDNGEEEFRAIVRISFTNSQDTTGEVRFVAGGEVFGWLGTDNVGRDLIQGILFGLPIALFIGVTVALFVVPIGASIGAISGYVGGKTDTLIQRFIDVMTTTPTLPIIIFLIFIFGARLSYVVFFLIIFGWTPLAIQLRPWIKQIRESGFITLARARGFSTPHIIFKELLPQTLPFLLATFVLMVPIAILAEASLSFLGLGDPSIPTWGFMLQQGFQTGAIFLGYWWWVLPPGIAIVLTSLTFVLISYPLEEYAEPRLQKE